MGNITQSYPENAYRAYKIIIIDDDDGANQVIQKKLKQAGFQTDTAKRGGDALRLIKGAPNELLLIGDKLPDISAKELVEKLKERYGTTPHFFILAGSGNEEIAVEMLKRGQKIIS